MILFTTGSILWLVYDILHEDLVIVGANATAATFKLQVFSRIVAKSSVARAIFLSKICSFLLLLVFLVLFHPFLYHFCYATL